MLAHLGEAASADRMGFLEEAISFEPTHSVCGNPVRFRTGKLPIKLDDQWRREMSRRDRLAVTLLAWPLLRLYGYTGRA